MSIFRSIFLFLLTCLRFPFELYAELVYGKDFDELHRWRTHAPEYSKWLNYEYPEIGITLAELESECRYSSKHYTNPGTARGISALRDSLRNLYPRAITKKTVKGVKHG